MDSIKGFVTGLHHYRVLGFRVWGLQGLRVSYGVCRSKARLTTRSAALRCTCFFGLSE